ncbi:ferrochelatase [Candidatus Deianiraea vastatrix]|uniref:Ferrochelatase n=1 Tax=Candidatus Deianiraea vastatrix TaxID=2163644 RepID=A0A5B8XE40_9RICK|nr:ferrochelatase [Candidatus Deianiraea vastatrix]QED23500.1 Ferrochelatase [Candidatus Deianiraea vastatrix]
MIEDPLDTNIKACCIVFNLGGPNNLDEVEPFLMSLFFDKRIIPLHPIPRFVIAKLISKLRKNKAKNIYKLLGGKSPIGENTLNQAIALQNKLIKDYSYSGDKSINWRVFYAMRHATPSLAEVLAQVAEFDPQHIVLMPLYPQYSTTTTESFFDIWHESINGLKSPYKGRAKVHKIIDYHDNFDFISSCSNLIFDYIQNNIKNLEKTRFLFSAHGLPQSIVDSGDPYQKQVEKSYELIVQSLEEMLKMRLDTRLCYQSKVGPKKWLTPSLETEIRACKTDDMDVCIFPIAFVSEHSETLVELDMEYLELAREIGIKNYFRIPTLAVAPSFISCLGKLVYNSVARDAD